YFSRKTMRHEPDHNQNAAINLPKQILIRVRDVWDRTDQVLRGEYFGFRASTEVPGVAAALSLLVTATLLSLSLPGSYRAAVAAFFRKWGAQVAIGAIATGIVCNEFIVARFLSVDGSLEALTISKIRSWQAMLLVCGVALLILRQWVFPIEKRESID